MTKLFCTETGLDAIKADTSLSVHSKKTVVAVPVLATLDYTLLSSVFSIVEDVSIINVSTL